MRFTTILLGMAVLLLGAAGASAEYQIHAYVPAGEHNEAQQLRVGQPGTIVLQVTSEEPLSVIKIPLTISSSESVTLWPTLSQPQVKFADVADSLPTQIANLEAWQHGEGTDTLIFWASSIGQTMPAGTYDLVSITVVPTQTGTVTLGLGSWRQSMVRHSVSLCGPGMTEGCQEEVDFVADPITVSECLVNCDGCCTGFTGNVDYDSDDVVDSSDLGRMVSYLFEPPGAVTLMCMTEANVDTEGAVDSSDLGTLVSYLFSPPGQMALPTCL